ncbi:MAG: hypothetical protein IPM25_19315 [Chloracidobacterium sp.]|nr:hypothetical protein [Chloracidobacterium sp.]
MVAEALLAEELGDLLDRFAEWLIVGENGRTFPINRDEISIDEGPRGTRIGAVGENGFRSRRIVGFKPEGEEIKIRLAGPFGGGVEEMRLVPRTSAAELAANIELARLERANAIATLVESSEEGVKLVRVGLNAGSGRFAEIFADSRTAGRVAVFADVAGGVTAESMLATAILWFERLQARAKKPALELHIVVESRAAANLQKLHALLKGPMKSSIRIRELSRTGGAESLKPRAELSISRLWREKQKQLNLPDELGPSEMAGRIIALAPEAIDILHSRHGETLRFNGLPFARVRKMAGRESAWFGVEKRKRTLNEASWTELERLVEILKSCRAFDSDSKRHEFYRHSPESWLESILRRNIKLLDANLILAPIYNQFRTAAADKIDLLALRRDGRLVVIEIKASPDRETPFQAADYWRKIEHLRRRGELRRARVFGDLEMIKKPPLVYAVAPALSFHRDFEHFARMLTPEIELWRFELHENWREEIKVIARKNYFDR